MRTTIINNKICSTIEDFYSIKVSKIRYSQTKKPIPSVGDFYQEFLVDGKRLPDKEVIEDWHDLLIWYINQPDAIFFVRKYEGGKKSGEWDNRRGAVVSFDDGFEIVYSSNFLAHDIFLMAYHGFVPDKKDFMTTVKNRKLHITSGTKVEKEIRTYTLANKGLSYCYLAHIMDVNGNYLRSDGSYSKLSTIEENTMFPRGVVANWKSSADGIWHVDYSLSNEEKALVKAHCIRFLDPMNYYLTPLTNQSSHSIKSLKKNIGEYRYLTYYIAQQYKHIFGNRLDELIDEGKYLEKAPNGYTGKEMINLEYSDKKNSSKGVFSASGTAVMVKPTGGKTRVKKKGSKVSNTIDLNKISKSYLQKFRACEIAKQVLRVIIEQGAANGSILKSDIDIFKTEKGRNKSTFMLAQPLLSSTIQDETGHKSYYVDPIVCHGETLYLNSQWGTDEERKENLINWIVQWVKHNGGINKHPLKKITRTKIPTIIKGEEQAPYKLEWRGEDSESDHIKYAGNVLPKQQVPQLCSCLESKYKGIVKFANHIFGDCFSDCFPERIRIELRKECPSRIYLNDDKYVSKKINELIKEKGFVTEKEISKILRFEDRICGVFIDEEPHIVIYFNQFYANTWDEYIAKIAKTLAHEYAHYLEYAYCKAIGVKSYQDACVSEAIADFFGVLYSINSRGIYKLQVAKDSYNKWVERFGSSWPYAYALYFYKFDGLEKAFSADFDEYGKSIQKLVRVFKAISNGSDAYDRLIN